MSQLKLLPCLCALSLLTGCAFSGEIADHAVAYNKTIEQSENEMLLLNILRASDQRPMHFTRISEFSGALDASASSALTIPFGRNTTNPFQSALTLSGSSKPTFKVQVLNTKEFYNGFLKPIDNATFSLFLASGWPMDALINALVEEAEVYVEETNPANSGTPQRSCKIIADLDSLSPPDGAYYFPQESMRFLADLLKESRRSTRKPSEDKFGVPIPRGSISDLQGLAQIIKEGYEPKAVTNEAGEKIAGQEINFQFVTSTSTSSFTSFGATNDEAFNSRANIAFKDGPSGFCADDKDKIEFIRAGQPRFGYDKFQFAAKLTLRSAQGILYALGEMLNFRNKADKEALARVDPDELEYFKVNKGGAAPPDAISTFYNGETYWIPTEGSEEKIGRETRRLLALAQQVFSLNTSSEDAPTTQTIRFIQ